MRVGFIICTRFASRRVPGKALLNINGKPLLWHLIDRLLKIKKPVILAMPEGDALHFQKTIEHYGDDVGLYFGSPSDPLCRTYTAARLYDLDHVIRVTHDKCFIDEACVNEMINLHMQKGLDYSYSSDLPAGAGFEIMSIRALEWASKLYKNVEHISYAIKAATKNKMDHSLATAPKTDARFLIDFPEDVEFMQTLFACIGNEVNLRKAVFFCNTKPWVKSINKQPEVSIYTCAYNAEKYIGDAINRTVSQANFKDYEYILVDDHSTDDTPVLMAEAAATYPNVKYIRNDSNKGLASSSNVALTHARGKYIVRIDADDYFSRLDAVCTMKEEIEERNLDAIYPGFYDGVLGKVGDPETNHHAAGALFKTRALNHIKFTEKLRNYEGYDLYLRAKTQLDIGYLKGPYFFYRHIEGSMSRSNLEKRAKVKQEIEAQHGV